MQTLIRQLSDRTVVDRSRYYHRHKGLIVSSDLLESASVASP